MFTVSVVNAVVVEPPIDWAPEPLNVNVPVVVSVPLFVKLPPTVWLRPPAASVVPVPIVRFPLIARAAAAVLTPLLRQS